MDLNSYKQMVNGIVVITAAASASCWFRSARAEVAANPEIAVVGALLGGDVITRNAKGERVDLIATMDLQSKWNRWDAIVATMSAVVQCLSAYLYP